MLPHDPLVFGSWEALIFWGVFVWAFAPEMRIARRAAKAAGAAEVASASETAGPKPEAERQTPSQDAGTTRLIFVANSITIAAALVASYLPWTVMSYPHVAFYLGTGLLVVGSFLRRWCWRALGTYFTGNVTVAQDQPVIDRGPYRWVRHPSYTAGIVMLVSIGIALGNWASVALLLFETWLIYTYRVRVEEKAMLATLGEPYRTYMARTKRFVPFVV